MLTIIPKETLGQILKYLPRHDIYHLLCSCNYLYIACLPYLYANLELGYHVYTRQLRKSIMTNQYLKNTISSKTKHLSLRSRRNANKWRLQDLVDIVGPNSRISSLTFTDFHTLSTEDIHQVAALLPNLRKIEFKYCHIVAHRGRTLLNNLAYNNYNDTTASSKKLDRISYIWTDFSNEASVIMPSLFSQITHLELGSNRNGHELVNELMIYSIVQHCPKITHLSIALPQVDESVLCDTIAHYGRQLQQLSIRCDGHRTLLAISAHLTCLQRLTIRVTTPSITTKDSSAYFFQIFKTCKQLQTLEIASMQLEQDVPDFIWESIITCAVGDSVAGQNKRLRAERALIVKQNKGRKDKNGLKTGIEGWERFPVRGDNSYWFCTVSEEALEQRYAYNNSLAGRYKHQTNRLERISLDQQELTAIRKALQLL